MPSGFPQELKGTAGKGEEAAAISRLCIVPQSTLRTWIYSRGYPRNEALVFSMVYREPGLREPLHHSSGEWGKGDIGMKTSGITLPFYDPKSGSLITSTQLLCDLEGNIFSNGGALVRGVIGSWLA